MKIFKNLNLNDNGIGNFSFVMLASFDNVCNFENSYKKFNLLPISPRERRIFIGNKINRT